MDHQNNEKSTQKFGFGCFLYERRLIFGVNIQNNFRDRFYMSLRLRKKNIFDFLMMLVGCAFYGASTSIFLAPNVIVAGGASGLGVLINSLFDKISVGAVIIAVNVPILLFSIKAFGWRFVVKSLITILAVGGVTDLWALMPNFDTDPLLATLYGGVCQGIGIGLFVRSNYSSGGTELLARLIVRKIEAVKIPVCLAVLDGLIVIGGAIATKSPTNMMYALIVIFVSTKISDIVIVGLEKSKLCIIVSDKGREISDMLLKSSPRGITMWDGKGMYTEANHDVLLTCVKNRQLASLKDIVKSVDPSAFIMIQDSVEVRGKGFTSLTDDGEVAQSREPQEPRE